MAKAYRCFVSILSGSLLGSFSFQAHAQESAGAVAGASDAFGFRSGVEVSGLYDADSARGFSPTAANNVRIEGLYADLPGVLSPRISDSSSVRVGAAVLGDLLPAPSGLVDYKIRGSGGSGLNLRAGVEPFGELVAEADGHVQLGRLSIAGGLGLAKFGKDFRGTRPSTSNAAVIARWSPSDRLRMLVFNDRTDRRRLVEPTYYTSGPFTPGPLPRGRFFGELWSNYDYKIRDSGAVVTARSGPIEAEAGLFDSVYDERSNTFDLVGNIDRNGYGERTIYLLPPQHYSSLSGEAKIGFGFGNDLVRQKLTLGMRARRAAARYGGDFATNFGRYLITRRVIYPRPSPEAPGEQTDDLTRQLTYVLGYERRSARTELALSVARSHHVKSVRLPEEPRASRSADPWLYNAMMGWRPTARSLVYASASRGLEASGVAPSGAKNRNQVLPAILTRQREIGYRVETSGLQIAVTGFSIKKPYAGLQPDGLFALNGAVRHDGVEASVTGKIGKDLKLLAGGLLLRGRVSGPLVALGQLSKIPIAVPDERVQIGMDYAPLGSNRLSLDFLGNYQGRRNAKLDGSFRLPPSVNVDVGFRYKLSPTLSMRGQIRNLLDDYSYTVGPDESLFYVPGRSWRLSLSTEI